VNEPVRSAPALRRVLGLGDVTGFLVVAVVGVRWIATAAATGPSALTVWLLAFLALFVPLAFAVVELSTRFPEEGGLYAWTKHAFGEPAAFLAGWMYWASNLVYFPALLYFTAGSALYLGGAQWQGLSQSPLYFIAFSLAGLALAYGLNVVGLGVGKWLNNLGAYATWIPIAALVALGVVAWSRLGSATSFAPAALVPQPSFETALFWSTIAFGYGGLEAASFMNEEIVEPRRTVPRAILAAGAIITAVYVLGTWAVLVALPPGEVSGLQGIMQAIESVAARVGAPAVAPLCAALITFGGIGGVGAWLTSVARLPFVAGLDRVLPPAFGRLHPRFGTPHVALLTQTVGAALFVVLGQAGATVQGAYDALVGMGVIAYFVPFLYLFGALFKLQALPAGPGVIRVPGGARVARALAAVGFLTTAVSIVLAVVPPADAPNPALAVLKVIGGSALLAAIGLALYVNGRRRRTP
jgi:amino acid transporter